MGIRSSVFRSNRSFFCYRKIFRYFNLSIFDLSIFSIFNKYLRERFDHYRSFVKYDESDSITVDLFELRKDRKFEDRKIKSSKIERSKVRRSKSQPCCFLFNFSSLVHIFSSGVASEIRNLNLGDIFAISRFTKFVQTSLLKRVVYCSLIKKLLKFL